MIRNNQFREDLFYRLNVCPIEIPPLRERREDIPLLVHYFVLRHSRQMQKRIKSVPKQAMEALVNADWPGNIRQLENFIERCVIFTQGDELNVLRAELKKPSVRSAASAAPSFEQAERQAIIDALIARLRKNSRQGRGSRAPWAEANDAPKQDEQAEYKSCRLFRVRIRPLWKPVLNPSPSKRPLSSIGFLQGSGNSARITALPVGRAQATPGIPR